MTVDIGYSIVDMSIYTPGGGNSAIRDLCDRDEMSKFAEGGVGADR